MSRLGGTIAGGTLLAGTLDLLWAFAVAAINGAKPERVLANIASGPFGDGMIGNGVTGVLIGGLVHYAIMAAMVTVFVLVAIRAPVLRRQWLVAGIIYGLILYGIMYWLVLPMRWPGLHPTGDPEVVVPAVLAHVLAVGTPIGWWTRRQLRA